MMDGSALGGSIPTCLLTLRGLFSMSFRPIGLGYLSQATFLCECPVRKPSTLSQELYFPVFWSRQLGFPPVLFHCPEFVHPVHQERLVFSEERVRTEIDTMRTRLFKAIPMERLFMSEDEVTEGFKTW